jgi:hypothetical protein
MKQIQLLYIGLFLLVIQQIKAQIKPEKDTSRKPNNSTMIEAGLYLSLPAHDDLLRTHTLAVGINARASKNISEKFEMGIRVEYDIRFAKGIRTRLMNDPDVTDETMIKASHRNLSLICVKPNIQFNLRSNCFFGAETGIGYAISQGNSDIGFGFVEEYNGKTQFGSCSGLYLGKKFAIGTKKKGLGLSLNWSNFYSSGHAENFAGLRLNYRFGE